MSDIFISYSTKDISYVKKITEELDKNGISYWLAPKNLPNEDQFGGQIIKGIRSAEIFLVLISSASQQSRHVMHELSDADRMNKYIVPFFVEDCLVTDEFEYYLAGKSALHSEESFSDALNRLISITLYLKAHDFPQKPRHIRCPQCGSSTLSEHVESRTVLKGIIRIACILAIVPYLYISLFALIVLLPINLVLAFLHLGEDSLSTLAIRFWIRTTQKLLKRIKYPLSTKFWHLRCADCKREFAVEIDIQYRRKDMILDLIPIQETNLLQNEEAVQRLKE